MVDIISNRLQEAYGSIRLPNVLGQNEPEERPTVAVLQRFGEQIRRKKQETKKDEEKFRERSLYNIKELPSLTIHPNLRVLRGLACRHCSPSDSVSYIILLFINLYTRK